MDKPKKTRPFEFTKGTFKITKGNKFVTVKITQNQDKLQIESIQTGQNDALRPKWQAIVDYLGIDRGKDAESKAYYTAYRLITETGHKDAKHQIEQINSEDAGIVKGIIADFKVSDNQPSATLTRYIAIGTDNRTSEIDIDKSSGMIIDDELRQLIQPARKPISNVNELSKAFHRAYIESDKKTEIEKSLDISIGKLKLNDSVHQQSKLIKAIQDDKILHVILLE